MSQLARNIIAPLKTRFYFVGTHLDYMYVKL